MIRFPLRVFGSGGKAFATAPTLPNVGDVLEHDGKRLLVTHRVCDESNVEVHCGLLDGQTSSTSQLALCLFRDAGTRRVFRKAYLPAPPPVGTVVESENATFYRVTLALLTATDAGADYLVLCDKLSDAEADQAFSALYAGPDDPPLPRRAAPR